MPQITKNWIYAVLVAGITILGAGCSSSDNIFNPETGKHAAGWSGPDAHGASAKSPAGSAAGFSACTECHSADFSGGISNTSCFTCHGVNAPHPAAPWRGARTHATTDESNAPVCVLCHANGANSTVQPSPSAPAGTPPGCFNATLCHATPGHPAGWALPDQHGPAAKTPASGFSVCQTCHGPDFTGSGAAITCLSTVGCHGAGVNAPHPPMPWRTSGGSARTHTDTNPGNAAVCGLCHLGDRQPPTYAPLAQAVGCFDNTLCHAQVGHPAGWAAPAQHGAAAKTAPSTTNMTGFSTCRSCHGANFGGAAAQTCLSTIGCHLAASPHAQAPWVSSVASTMTHTTTDALNADACGLCHWNNVQPPTYSSPVPGTPNCFDNTLCHGPAASFDCVTCHGSAVNAPTASTVSAGSVTQRRAIVPEFALTWSHKRSASGAVTNGDCIVCHMEGVKATLQRDPAYHADGYVDLRDPDTGTTIQGATFNGGTPGAYTSGGSGRFTQFNRNLASATLEANVTAIQINHCLKCHDADGAANANAQVAGGSALQPFGVAITGHSAPFDSNGNGNVVNVAASFATTNASYHPVLGKGDNSYTDDDRMVAPWNGIAKTEGAAAGTQWGYLISCWDCHAPTAAAGVQNSTVTAHGGAVTLRAPVYQSTANTTATNLCINCHVTEYATSVGDHLATGGTGASAFATGNSNMNATIMQRCANCHAYTAAQGGTSVPTLTLRPLRAENVHGFNDRDPVTAGQQMWVNGANSHRPYAFIRNTLSYWSPQSVSTAGESLQRSAGCTGTGGTCNNNMGTGTTYTVGGSY